VVLVLNIYTGYNVNPKCALEVKGVVNIHNGTPFAINNYTLNNGSLIIGDTLSNYGGGHSGMEEMQLV
jgi:hypothetical protein